MSDRGSEPGDAARDRVRFAKELASGVGIAGFLIWLTFFGTAGLVEIATLVLAVAMLIWFASVDPARLTDGTRTPSLTLFLLASMACAVVLTAALIMGTATLFLVTLLTLAAIVVGLIRALGHRYRQRPETDDAVL